MNSISNFFFQGFKILIQPLYIYGPSYLGFCEGKHHPDICSEMTTVGADFWSKSGENVQECESMIDRRFDSYIILFIFVCVVFFVLRIISCLFAWSTTPSIHSIVKEIVTEIKKK